MPRTSAIATTPFAVFDAALTNRLQGGCQFADSLELATDDDVDIDHDVSTWGVLTDRPALPAAARGLFAAGQAQRHKVQSTILSLLVDFHRVTASGCISDPIYGAREPEFAVMHPDTSYSHFMVFAPEASKAVAPVADYPEADFYEPVKYGWTPDSYIVRA